MGTGTKPLRLASSPEHLHAILTPQKAQILGSHIRLDADFHRRLPRSLLIRFTIKTEPVSQRPILLPEGIDYDKEILWNKNGAKYALATQFAIDIMTPGKGRGGKQWVKLVDESARQMMVASGIWRNDMATFIRDKIRKRVVAECGSNQISTRHDRVVGGLESWEKAGEVMCVLDFRRKGEKWVEDNDTLLNITEGGSWANREPPPKMDKDGLMTVVCGRRVPVHPMRKMLGDEMVEELMKNWQVEEGRPLMALMMTCRTTGMQEWLMKLRYYLGLWYAPEELQKEGKSEWGKDL